MDEELQTPATRDAANAGPLSPRLHGSTNFLIEGHRGPSRNCGDRPWSRIQAGRMRMPQARPAWYVGWHADPERMSPAASKTGRARGARRHHLVHSGRCKMSLRCLPRISIRRKTIWEGTGSAAGTTWFTTGPSTSTTSGVWTDAVVRKSPWWRPTVASINTFEQLRGWATHGSGPSLAAEFYPVRCLPRSGDQRHCAGWLWWIGPQPELFAHCGSCSRSVGHRRMDAGRYRWTMDCRNIPINSPAGHGCSSWRQVVHESRLFELRYRGG